MVPFRVVLLPGSVLPGDLAYGSLAAALGSATDAVVKELEVYSTPEAPPDYTLDLEVAGVLRDADQRAWERFHLVGYSAGGAAALAFAARHSERLATLALLEPAWAGRWDLSSPERALWTQVRPARSTPAGPVHAFVYAAQRQAGSEAPAETERRTAAVDGKTSWRDRRIHEDLQDVRARPRRACAF